MGAQPYFTKPVPVEAWQITEENLAEVASWCNGKVKGLSITLPRIKEAGKVNEDYYQYAVIGTWIVRVAKGYKVVTDTVFKQDYVPPRRAPLVPKQEEVPVTIGGSNIQGTLRWS